MYFPGMRKTLKGRQIISALALVFVFFLPLHFHSATAASSHLSNECSCLHGTRAQMGVTAVAVHWAAPFQFVLNEPFEPQIVSKAGISFQSIRAPPVL
jgi:hypothetical protein